MSTDHEREATAGNYVLGLLDDAERAAVEREMTADPALRNAVDRLTRRFVALDDTAQPVPVAATTWEAVIKRIADMPQTASPSGPPNSSLAPASSVTPLSARRGVKPSFWRPALTAAGLFVAAGLGYLVGTRLESERSPVVVVVLNTDQHVPGAIFEAFADDTLRIVPLQNFEVPAGKTLQVWTLYDRAVGPVSLGTLEASTEAVLQGPRLPVPKAEQLYEITLEPAPGSPTGKPTGPILVKGYAKLPAG